MPEDIVTHIAQQLDFDAEELRKYNWRVGRIKQHRKEIREWLGFRPITVADQRVLRDWLQNDVIPHEYRPAHLEQLVRRRLKQLHIEPPSAKRLQERIINSSIHHYAHQLFKTNLEQIPEATRNNLNQLITLDVSLPEEGDGAEETTGKYPFRQLITCYVKPNSESRRKLGQTFPNSPGNVPKCLLHFSRQFLLNSYGGLA